MTDIFSYDDYKCYLKDILESTGYGSRMKLATALNCHSAYISQVLNQSAQLNLEQALETASFLSLNSEEEDFFLTLVQKERAGTVALSAFFQNKIKQVRQTRALLSSRIKDTEELDEYTQSKYYSRWYYAAIHMLIAVPSFRTKDAISKYLGLPMSVTSSAVDFLVESKLIENSGAGYLVGKRSVFLRGDSPLIVQHHENWRLKAMDSMMMGRSESIHFSSVYSLSRSDFVALKEKLLTHLQEVRTIIKPSPEEEVCVLNLDFFSLHHK